MNTKRSLYRAVADIDDLMPEHMVIAYATDADYANNNPWLKGAVELVVQDGQIGHEASWQVKHASNPYTSEWTNFSSCKHIFRITDANHRDVGFNGPWSH